MKKYILTITISLFLFQIDAQAQLFGKRKNKTRKIKPKNPKVILKIIMRSLKER